MDLKRWFEALPRSCLEAIESVSMDMWPAFINAALEMVPGAESKIAFDKFHVAKYLGEAVDKVRREEHRKLMKAGKADLEGTKYDWLYVTVHSRPLLPQPGLSESLFLLAGRSLRLGGAGILHRRQQVG